MIEYPRPEPRPATLLERLTGAGIGEERARATIVSGGVRVAGHEEPVTDPEASVPWPTAWELLPSS
ncbi:hypothetical protein [Actinomycetospora chiangmaiensis]|uniref:hypothetical protein n=1 Tax=Actinomycetospora chiangmaiensis TaxID=402650 RepID=UPI000372FC66|nr:hypothetical protein [Actinomycetospora chiangmaiensis]